METAEAERVGEETVEAERAGAETEEEGLAAGLAMRSEEDAEAATLEQVVGLEMRLEEVENWAWTPPWAKKKESKGEQQWQSSHGDKIPWWPLCTPSLPHTTPLRLSSFVLLFCILLPWFLFVH